MPPPPSLRSDPCPRKRERGRKKRLLLPSLVPKWEGLGVGAFSFYGAFCGGGGGGVETDRRIRGTPAKVTLGESGEPVNKLRMTESGGKFCMAVGNSGSNKTACPICDGLRAEVGRRPSRSAVRPASSRLP